jgi:hypothetical protein
MVDVHMSMSGVDMRYPDYWFRVMAPRLPAMVWKKVASNRAIKVLEVIDDLY